MQPIPPAGPPGPRHRLTASPRPPALPERAPRTDRLLYRWEHLRADQQRAAWVMVDAMRASVARDHRRQRIMAELVLIGVVADAVLLYVVLHVPVR